MNQRRIEEPEFWLINKSFKKDISLGDLRITIRKGEKKNLLSKHYNFTIEQLRESASTGSIFKKSNTLAVREIKPVAMIKPLVKDVEQRRVLKPIRNPELHTGVDHYEELDFDDEFMAMTEEQFAEEQAEAERNATAPVLAVDKKFIEGEED